MDPMTVSAAAGAAGQVLGGLFSLFKGKPKDKLQYRGQSQDLLMQELLSSLDAWGSPLPLAMLESDPKMQKDYLSKFGDRFTPDFAKNINPLFPSGVGVGASNPWVGKGGGGTGVGNQPNPAGVAPNVDPGKSMGVKSLNMLPGRGSRPGTLAFGDPVLMNSGNSLYGNVTEQSPVGSGLGAGFGSVYGAGYMGPEYGPHLNIPGPMLKPGQTESQYRNEMQRDAATAAFNYLKGPRVSFGYA